MSRFQNDSIFWVEVDKIQPNPYQPRKIFSEGQLRDLAESIRQYGILQPLTVTRVEVPREDGGLNVMYELIAGERRHRAARIAGLSQVPVIIRSGEESDQLKLELAIIENLQREDLNPVDRARAFDRLVREFGFKHVDIGKKMGRSREYVTNTIRLLALPEYVLDAILSGKVSEGHARPMLMLKDRPEEQETLYKEVLYKKITVREAEQIARKIAYDKARKKDVPPDPEIMQIEEKLSSSFGTRVQIERKDVGGKIVINFFSPEDLKTILGIMESKEGMDNKNSLLNRFEEKINGEMEGMKIGDDEIREENKTDEPLEEIIVDNDLNTELNPFSEEEKTDNEINEDELGNDDDMYSIKNFSI